ncbi:MAG TPA: 2Fe-2S iron-sulfur cluster-binding protein [Terriglobales bacterium]|nr:2Fe-2S iron-sulfur cluster-binding protein [Terriglobales bacterium]
MAEVNLEIDGRALRVPAGTTVLKAAERLGIVIPRFCFHPAFEPEGSCRMCLVEVEGLPKLDLACSTIVREGMKVRTSTPKALQARRDVLEFLLADHPLDCPICDKAGECLLQEYYDAHGRYPSAFLEPKEKKAKKLPLGRALLLDRERCVLCSRCVRFLRKVTKTGELGIFERGVRSEVGLDNGAEVLNNYSGNLVDICPVGAITDTDFRFKTRVWFLKNGRTVCPRCGRGCAIIVQSVCGYPLSGDRRKVYRIVPAENPEVNGYWICDRGRYAVPEIEDGRAEAVSAKAGGMAGTAAPLSWDDALRALTADIRGAAAPGRPPRLGVVLTSFLTNEELEAAQKIFVQALGVTAVHFADPAAGEPDGLLMTADRTPNRRGAEALGFTLTQPDLGALAGAVDVLLVFGPHLLDRVPLEEAARALAGIGRTWLLTPRKSSLDGLADVVLPTALPQEKSGSFTNVDGLRQHFEPALRPPRGSRPEGRILADLAAALGMKLE